VLTRPLGATVGDFLDKPLDHGGLALSRYTASASLAAVMVLLILLLPQRSGGIPRDYVSDSDFANIILNRNTRLWNDCSGGSSSRIRGPSGFAGSNHRATNCIRHDHQGERR
jgi:hypothetical protein